MSLYNILQVKRLPGLIMKPDNFADFDISHNLKEAKSLKISTLKSNIT